MYVVHTPSLDGHIKLTTYSFCMLFFRVEIYGEANGMIMM